MKEQGKKTFLKETGLTRSIQIEAINLDWLIRTNCPELTDLHVGYLTFDLNKAIREGEVETVGDAIIYIDNYC